MNKPVYNNDDRVQIAINGDVSNIVYGTVVGWGSQHVIDFWLVRLDKRLDHYPYDVIFVQHTFLRKLGDNKPFLCEIGSFAHDA